MDNDTPTHDPEKSANPSSEEGHEAHEPEPEFKVTVRKLEMPVRPRGVLAE